MIIESKETSNMGNKITKETEAYTEWLTGFVGDDYTTVAAEVEIKARKRAGSAHTLEHTKSKDSDVEDFFAEEMSNSLKEILVREVNEYPVDGFEPVSVLIMSIMEASLDQIDYKFAARAYRKTFKEKIEEEVKFIEDNPDRKF